MLQWKWIKAMWPFIEVFVLVGLGICVGYKLANVRQQAKLEALKKQHADQMLEAQISYIKNIQAVTTRLRKQQQHSQQVGVELEKANIESRRLKQKIKQGNRYAIEEDKKSATGCIDGLGAHSLQQYNAALGYYSSDSSDSGSTTCSTDGCAE